VSRLRAPRSPAASCFGCCGETPHRTERPSGEHDAEDGREDHHHQSPGGDQQDLGVQDIGDRRHRHGELHDAAGTGTDGHGKPDDKLITVAGGDLLRA